MIGGEKTYFWDVPVIMKYERFLSGRWGCFFIAIVGIQTGVGALCRPSLHQIYYGGKKCILHITADGVSDLEPIEPSVATVAKMYTTMKTKMGLVCSLRRWVNLGHGTVVVNTETGI